MAAQGEKNETLENRIRLERCAMNDVRMFTTNTQIGQICAIFDNDSSTIASGSKFRIRTPFAGTITKATAILDQTGDLEVEVRKCTYAQYDGGATHPVTGDKISGTSPVSVSSAVKSQTSTLTGWTTTVNAGDIFEFYVSSALTATYAIVQLDVEKS